MTGSLSFLSTFMQRKNKTFTGWMDNVMGQYEKQRMYVLFKADTT